MISMIVAMDENRLIGSNNKLPWHFKEDLHYFKKVTTGHDIFMGRLTYESIIGYRGKPLPNRHHFVASKTNSVIDNEFVTTVKDIDFFIDTYPREKELFIIGGAKIYEHLVSRIDRLYITYVKHAYEGDAWFPKIDLTQFNSSIQKETQDLCFVLYERK